MSGIKLNSITYGHVDLAAKNDFMLMLMYVYTERIKKKQGVKYSIKTCCRKGLQEYDVVSLLFVPPDAKKIKYFPKCVENL